MTESASGKGALFVAVDVQYLGHADARAALVAARDRRFARVTGTRVALTYRRRSRTSRESRTASPIRLNATTVRISMTAGGYTFHQ